MKTKKEKEKKAKAGKGLMAIGIISMMVIGMSGGIYYLRSNTNIDEGINNLLDDTEEEYHQILRWLPGIGAEISPGTDGESGILAVWCYVAGNVTDLANNGTVWDPDEGGHNSTLTVYGYAHSAGFSEDLDHTVNWTLCVRVRINTTNMGGARDETHVRAYLNMTSADWSDGQNAAGLIHEGRTVSANASDTTFVFINFYWQDGAGDDTGYAINADGRVSIDDFIVEGRW